MRSTSRVWYGLEDVAFAQVVEALEQDAALKAFAHLAGVVLEPAELRNRGLVDAGPLAPKMRTFEPRRMTPLVTMQPAIVPRRETRKRARTSTSPMIASVSTGVSSPTSPQAIRRRQRMVE